MVKQSNTSGNGKHVISWLVLLAGIPVFVIIMAIWYIIASWITGLLAQSLPWLYESILKEGITDIISALGGLLLLLFGAGICYLSHKIYPTEHATRYIVTGVISGILTIFGAVCSLLGYIPLSAPLQLGHGFLFSITYALGIYTYKMITGGMEGRRTSMSPLKLPQTICVFGYVEKLPNATFQPFCYITDSPGLMNPDGSLNENRGSDPEYLRRFEKMKQVALDRQNCPSDAYQNNLLAYLGFIAGERVYFTDIFSIDTLTGKASYANLYDSNDKQKNIQGVEVADLKGKKHYKATADGTFVSADGKVCSGQPTKGVSSVAAPKLKIYLLLDSSLSIEDRSLVSEAAYEANKLFPLCEVVNMDNSPRAETNRKNTDTYLEGTISDGQADSSVVIRKLQNVHTALPNAAAVILLTAKDLYSSSLGLSWCFGAANYKKHVSVQSVFRYQKLTNEEKLRCIRRTLRHELGHIFGLADDSNRVNTENHFGQHCTAPGCSMRQTETLPKLLQYSAEEDRLGTYFCKDCLADLNRYFSKQAPLKKPASTTKASKSAPRQTPVTEKTPKSREELLDTIFEYYSADIFASAERLHIHLENVFDLRKETFNTATLKAILDDLKEKASN